jgi:hypothetical protein
MNDKNIKGYRTVSSYSYKRVLFICTYNAKKLKVNECEIALGWNSVLENRNSSG